MGKYICGLTTLACLVVIGATGCGGSPTGSGGAETGPTDEPLPPGPALRHTHLVRLQIAQPGGGSPTSPAPRRGAVSKLAAGGPIVLRADALTTVDSIEPDGSRTMTVEALGTVGLQGGGGPIGYTYVHRLGVDGSSQIDEFTVDVSQLPAGTRQRLTPLLHAVELVSESHLAGLLIDDASAAPITIRLASSPLVGGSQQPAVAFPATLTFARRRVESPLTRVARTFTLGSSRAADVATLLDATLSGPLITSGDSRVVDRSSLTGSGRIAWPGAGTFTVRLTSTVASAQPAPVATP